jgi:hypothetical protein
MSLCVLEPELQSISCSPALDYPIRKHNGAIEVQKKQLFFLKKKKNPLKGVDFGQKMFLEPPKEANYRTFS